MAVVNNRSKKSHVYVDGRKMSKEKAYALEIIPRHCKRAVESEADLISHFNSYMQYCEENDKLPNMAGFATFIDVSKQTLLNYIVPNHIYFETMRRIKTAMEDCTINSKIGDNFKKFYMTNVFRGDYVDRVEHDNRNIDIDLISVIKANMTPAQIQEAAALIAAKKAIEAPAEQPDNDQST